MTHRARFLRYADAVAYMDARPRQNLITRDDQLDGCWHVYDLG